MPAYIAFEHDWKANWTKWITFFGPWTRFLMYLKKE